MCIIDKNKLTYEKSKKFKIVNDNCKMLEVSVIIIIIRKKD